ncbi:MAG: hypothetical protein JW891_14595 [Candidatus Lokiarchaeota archaeon]|nr:hypothetical protein [Candidatus Lokiarchaeota archaeon]
MQIFEVVELAESPYFKTIEVTKGEKVKDILLDSKKVFLLVDHDSKKIWIYNGIKSELKHQVYGSVLADFLKKQLKMFYRVFLLNEINPESQEFKQLAEKNLGGGRAIEITESDIAKKSFSSTFIKIDTNIRINKVLASLSERPQPDPAIYKKRLVVCGGSVYSEEEEYKTFLKDDHLIVKPIKLGQLNNGFTFFDDHNYSTRLTIKDRKVQAIELFVKKAEKIPSLELEVPTIPDDKLSTINKIEQLKDAFRIPEEIVDHNEK